MDRRAIATVTFRTRPVLFNQGQALEMAEDGNTHCPPVLSAAQNTGAFQQHVQWARADQRRPKSV
jgi:hypothetical protein